MSNDDLTQTSTATTTNNLIPVNIDREPIIFSDNDASLEGILYEVGRFYKRTGQFQMLFKHRAVSLSNGKLAVESLNSAYLLDNCGSIASSTGTTPRPESEGRASEPSLCGGLVIPQHQGSVIIMRYISITLSSYPTRYIRGARTFVTYICTDTCGTHSYLATTARRARRGLSHACVSTATVKLDGESVATLRRGRRDAVVDNCVASAGRVPSVRCGPVDPIGYCTAATACKDVATTEAKSCAANTRNYNDGKCKQQAGPIGVQVLTSCFESNARRGACSCANTEG